MSSNPFDPPQPFDQQSGPYQTGGPQQGGAPQHNSYPHPGGQAPSTSGNNGYPPANLAGHYAPTPMAQPPAPEKQKNWFARHKFLTAVLALVGVVVIANLGGTDSKEPTAQATASQEPTAGTSSESATESTKEAEPETSKEEPAQEQELGFKIGDVAKAGDMTYQVTSVKTAKKVGSEYLDAKAKGTFVVVSLKVTNNSSESALVTTSFFTLKNGEKKFEADSSASIYANSEEGFDSFFTDQLNPDLTMEGLVVFDVSDAVAESKDNVLSAQTGFWGTETVDIQLVK